MNRAVFVPLIGIAAMLLPTLCRAQSSAPVGPVLIGGQPQSQMVVAQGSATFSVTAIGSAPITYQWNRNGSPITGATSPAYTIPVATSADNGATFTVTVGNAVNSFTSAPATLAVASGPVAPTIVGQPQNIQVSQSETASFYVFATGTGPLSYQWKKNGSPISGATSATYTTPATTSGDNNTPFIVTVTNSAGSVTSAAGTLFVTSTPAGLGGFSLPRPGYDGSHDDLIGVQYKFNVVTNNDPNGKIIFGFNYLYTPGAALGGYDIESNVYSWRVSYANGGCTNFPPLGTNTFGEASLRNATADYPYQAGQQPAVGSAMNTSDSVNWPVQTYLVDNIPKLYKSDSMSQFNINGTETLVTVQRGGTLTDVSRFARCGIPMLPTIYRRWTVTTQVAGRVTVVNEFVAPDADARYIVPAQAMQFASEFLSRPGPFVVQYWDFAYMTELNPVWTPASSFMTSALYDGSGQDFGIHVVSVNGRDRIEFSNLPGNSYLSGNLPFSIAPRPGSVAPQEITFGTLSNVVLGAVPIAVSATASSGLVVSFTSTTTTVCTVSGSTVMIVAAGTCSITASQAGNANYAAATPVTQSFTVILLAGGSPMIRPGGIVPVDSRVTTIQPGEWVSIFGTNLAASTVGWNGDFPTSLGGTSVKINGKAAYISFVSPGQINLQAPDDAATGIVPAVVTTGNGSSTATVTLASFGPSFFLLDAKHVAGIIVRSDGSGAYAKGTYDIIGPTGTSLGYPTVAAKAGDIIELFGTGFGPTSPAVPAGQAFSGAASTTNPVLLGINGVSVTPTFAGLSGAGLYQINLTVPTGLGTGDVSLQANVSGVQTPSGIVISLL